MVAIGNPIIGILHPYEWQRPAGNTDFKVTQTAARHAARPGTPPPPMALDIGDGDPDLDPILAPHDAVVSQAFTVGSANLSLDFDSGGKKWRIVLAHSTLPHPVSVGQAVKEGQQVGRMGATGATAIHLHIQLGYLAGSTWTWVDPWIYLRQNGATEGEMLQGANPVAVHNKLGKVLGDNTRFRSSPFVKPDNILAEFDVGAEFAPHFIVDGTSALGTNRWYGAWGNVGTSKQFGYVNVNTLSSLQPIEQSGHTDAELIEAAKRASYNAATDVSAMAANTAAKYPKP